MERINIDGKEVLVGLDWTDLEPGVNEGRAIARVLQTPIHKGKRMGVVVHAGEDRSVGLAPANAKVPGKVPSAAAWLARAAQARMHSGAGDSEGSTTDAKSWNWVVIEPLDEGMYWMVAIYKGVPMATTDVVAPFEQVIKLSEGFQAVDEFTVYTRDADVQRAVSHFGTTSSMGVAQLLDGIPEGDIKPSDLWVRQVAGLRMPMFLAALGVLLLLGVLVVGLHLRAQRQAEELRAKQAAAAAASEQEIQHARTQYEQDVQDAVNKALTEGKAEIDNALVSPSPSLVVAQWTSLLGSINLDQSTWQLAKVHCTGSKVPACQITLSRGDMGVNRLLLAEHPDAVIEGDTATYQLTGDTLGTRTSDWSRLADGRSFMVDLLSDLQLLRNAGIEYHQDASKEMARPVVLPQPASAKFKPGSTEQVGPPPTVQMGVATGKMGLGSTALWQLQGLAEFLDHDGVILNDMDVTINDSGINSWKINATYWIRSKPQPVLPTILSEGKPLALTLPKAFAEPRQATGSVGASNGAPAELTPAPASSTASGGGALLPPPPPLPTAVSPPTQRF